MAKNLDMFSSFPESLHLSIISLLPYKEAARTSILSKQWFETWRKTKMIDVEFDELFFEKPDEFDESKEAHRRNFLNSITYWISHNRNQFVDKFSLKVSHPESCREIIEHCFAFATQRGVKDLRLDFSDPNWKENTMDEHTALMQLPQHVYDLGSLLESLKLYSCGFSMPHMLKFRSLKEISLGWIEISVTTLRTLLYSCKTLQNLSLKKCGELESFNMGDEKIGLKRLVIDKCQFEYTDIFFDAPNLVFFKYSGGVWNSDINIKREVMEEVEIDFPYEFEPNFNEYADELYTILSDFYHVRVLTVCSVLLQKYISRFSVLTCEYVFLVMHEKLKAIPFGEDKIRHGLNVRHLILKTQMHPNELYGFTFLLESCPWLEKLTLEIGPRVIYNDYEPPYNIDLQKFWERPMLQTPECLAKTLEVVEIKGCTGSLDEFKACFYLIGLGSSLKEMNIYLMKDENEEIRRGIIAQFVPGFPRASKDLDILIA
ncbi:putative F-box/LRR-repeat protein At1g56400 [Lotus japonicus]|uniref:putative F-box/LRR-repeat protein At1g56400 n=1 Tax=Lotus japonicus TaxID=34305 RepID=UPI00258AAB6B|nr:putative F-box/LRR-repeat protein At1g56400 [Lotus japonicus]